MDRASYLESLRRDAADLFSAATPALAADVPTCPGWTVERLVGHVGRVYRWTAGWITTGAAVEVERPPTGDAVVTWARAGLDELVTVLDTGDSGAGGGPGGPAMVATWAGQQPAIFWPRRMAIETALHRWDAQATRGDAAPVSAPLALDAIDELFEVILPSRGTVDVAPDGTTVHLHATDVDGGAGEWLVTFGSAGIAVEHAHAKGDLAVRATASELLLLLWNRIGPERCEVFGDAGLLERWRAPAGTAAARPATPGPGRRARTPGHLRSTGRPPRPPCPPPPPDGRRRPAPPCRGPGRADPAPRPARRRYVPRRAAAAAWAGRRSTGRGASPPAWPSPGKRPETQAPAAGRRAARPGNSRRRRSGRGRTTARGRSPAGGGARRGRASRARRRAVRNGVAARTPGRRCRGAPRVPRRPGRSPRSRGRQAHTRGPGRIPHRPPPPHPARAPRRADREVPRPRRRCRQPTRHAPRPRQHGGRSRRGVWRVTPPPAGRRRRDRPRRPPRRGHPARRRRPIGACGRCRRRGRPPRHPRRSGAGPPGRRPRPHRISGPAWVWFLPKVGSA